MPNSSRAELGEYYTVHPALCHHHMSTHCLPLGRRSLWLTKTQVTCHYTNEPCYSECAVIHGSLFCRPKWNHIIMHLFIMRVETDWSSPLSHGRQAEQKPVSAGQPGCKVTMLGQFLVQCNLISCSMTCVHGWLLHAASSHLRESFKDVQATTRHRTASYHNYR